MNLNFPPIVSQEFFIDTGKEYSDGTFLHKLTHLTGGSLPGSSPTPPSPGPGVGYDLAPMQHGWLRDLAHEMSAGGSPRPLHFDLSDLGNEGEILSIMAWLGDHNTRDETGTVISGNVNDNCFKFMKIYIGNFFFGEIGTGAGVGTDLNYPDSYHGPMPTNLFYESDLLYPGFSESVDVVGATPGTRLPFFQENFSTPIPYIRGKDPYNTDQLGMGITWKLFKEQDGGPTNPRSVMRIRITARRFR